VEIDSRGEAVIASNSHKSHFSSNAWPSIRLRGESASLYRHASAQVSLVVPTIVRRAKVQPLWSLKVALIIRVIIAFRYGAARRLTKPASKISCQVQHLSCSPCSYLFTLSVLLVTLFLVRTTKLLRVSASRLGQRNKDLWSVCRVLLETLWRVRSKNLGRSTGSTTTDIL
jgi:hypothetical protein